LPRTSGGITPSTRSSAAAFWTDRRHGPDPGLERPISSEILFKAAGSGIPVLISKSAPTDMGVDLARELGITLVGFVRGGG